jgi:hypothetical protein
MSTSFQSGVTRTQIQTDSGAENAGGAGRPPRTTSKSSKELLLEMKLAITEDGGVLLDLRNDRLLKLNPSAVEFWNALAAGKSENEIVEETVRGYGADRRQVKEDLCAFQTCISELGLSVPPASTKPDARAVLSSLPAFPWYAGKQDENRVAKYRFWTACALAGLLTFDFVLSVFSMKGLCRLVHRWPTIRKAPSNEVQALQRICRSAERASVWYPKKTLCLQRSAVTTCLLRLCGLPAELVIGAQPMPFQAHAWVELRGSVVNDHKGVTRVYPVLARY